MRIDGRHDDEVRSVVIQPGFLRQALGSVFIEWGATRVLVSVNREERVPPFLQGTGQGWVTAEYTLLSRVSGPRVVHGWNRAGVSGRAVEIRRFIGRSLRAALDLVQLGEQTLWVDCDVLEADGGTRVASVTGGFLAICLALDRLVREGQLERFPVRAFVAAISVGWIEDRLLVDMNFFEDSQADVDMNLVMTGRGELIELQLTGEHAVLAVDRLRRAIDVGWSALQGLLPRCLAPLEGELKPEHFRMLEGLVDPPEKLPWSP